MSVATFKARCHCGATFEGAEGAAAIVKHNPPKCGNVKRSEARKHYMSGPSIIPGPVSSAWRPASEAKPTPWVAPKAPTEAQAATAAARIAATLEYRDHLDADEAPQGKWGNVKGLESEGAPFHILPPAVRAVLEDAATSSDPDLVWMVVTNEAAFYAGIGRRSTKAAAYARIGRAVSWATLPPGHRKAQRLSAADARRILEGVAA